MTNEQAALIAAAIMCQPDGGANVQALARRYAGWLDFNLAPIHGDDA